MSNVFWSFFFSYLKVQTPFKIHFLLFEIVFELKIGFGSFLRANAMTDLFSLKFGHFDRPQPTLVK